MYCEDLSARRLEVSRQRLGRGLARPPGRSVRRRGRLERRGREALLGGRDALLRGRGARARHRRALRGLPSLARRQKS